MSGASFDFSRALAPFIRTFYEAWYEGGVGGLREALRGAVVAAAGRLIPRHEGLARYLLGLKGRTVTIEWARGLRRRCVRPR